MAQVQTESGFVVDVDDGRLEQFNNFMRNMTDLHALRKLSNKQILMIIEDTRSLFRVNFPKTRTLADWFIFHLERPDVEDLQVMFIRDTILYLKEGYRRIPLAMYSQFFDAPKVRGANSISQTITFNGEKLIKRNDEIKELIRSIRKLDSEESLFYRWVCSKERVMDYIYFLKFLLGEKEGANM